MPKVQATIEPHSSFHTTQGEEGKEGQEEVSAQSPSSSGRDSLSDSPLSSLENLSSLLLSSHSLASMMDDVTSSSSLAPSSELSSHSLDTIPSPKSEDELSKSFNVFSNEQSCNIAKAKGEKEETFISMELKKKKKIKKKKNHPKSILANETYNKLKVTLDGAPCDPNGTFIEEQVKDIGNTHTLTTHGNDHLLHHRSSSSLCESNGNVLHLDESYKCNPLMAVPLKEKTGYTDEKTNGTLSHYHSNHFTYSPSTGTSMSKGHRSSVQVTLYENKLSQMLLLNTHRQNEEKSLNEPIEPPPPAAEALESTTTNECANDSRLQEGRKNHKEDMNKVHQESHDSFCFPSETVQLDLDTEEPTSRD